MKIALTVNGRPAAVEVPPRTQLADCLRDHLNLTGTHIGCEHGVCGACTVVINGETARSCITYAVQCEGAEVRTIEGFAQDPLMARLREAFKREHALQCGYCTPGMLIAARDLIRRKGGLNEAAIRVAMSGNLCRCTGYVGIVRAIQSVMTERDALLANVEPAARHLGALPLSAGTAGLAEHGGAPAKTMQVVRSSAAHATSAPSTTAPWDETGATRLEEHLRIAAPRVRVAALMADIEQMAACLPGARLDGPPEGGHIRGRLDVKLGPIAAGFAGEGRVVQAADGFSGAIEGQGRDGASRARGRIHYSLAEEGPEASRIDFVVAYALTGPLAQFSRGGLVKDLVAEIARTFARNIEARLQNPEAAMQPAELSAGKTLLRVLWSRLKALLGVART